VHNFEHENAKWSPQFDVLFLKLLKIVARRDLKPEIHQIPFGSQAPPGPAGELKHFLRTPSCNKGAYF